MYIPSRSEMVEKRTKLTTMPDRMSMIYAGRTIQARSMNRALKRRPQAAAAAKGGVVEVGYEEFQRSPDL